MTTDSHEIFALPVTGTASRWWTHLGILLPILLVYLVLACYGLGRQSLWLDEIFSVRDAASPALFWHKHHGPLYFALLHVWMPLGHSEAILRTLSVILGAMAVCLFYATCISLFSRRLVVVASLLFATSPLVIWYSQEVRYVILMLASSLFAVYAFRRVLARDHFGAWVMYGSAALLTLLSFVTTAFLIMAQGLYLLWVPTTRPLFRKWLMCLFVFSLPFIWWTSAWIVDVFQGATATNNQQQHGSGSGRGLTRLDAIEFSPMMLPYTFFAFSAGYSQGPSVHALHQSRSVETLLPHIPRIAALGLLFGGLAVAGLIALWRQSEVIKWLLLWMGVPLLGVVTLSLMTGLGYNVRYVSVLLPAYLIVVAAGIVSFRRLAVQVTLLAIVLLSSGVSLGNYYFDDNYARTDSRAAAQYLTSMVRSQDLALVVGDIQPLRYYVQERIPLKRVERLNRIQRPLEDYLAAVLEGYDRVWVVELRSWQTDPKGKVKLFLDSAYDLLEHQHFAGVDIYCYRLQPRSLADQLRGGQGT